MFISTTAGGDRNTAGLPTGHRSAYQPDGPDLMITAGASAFSASNCGFGLNGRGYERKQAQKPLNAPVSDIFSEML